MKLPDAHVSAAGSIQNLLTEPCGCVSIIHSKAGSVRSSHYHRTDWHYLYVLSGQMRYSERAVAETEWPEFREVNEGEMVFTPPLVAHLTHFPVDTVLISMSKRARDHESHEADVVRVQ